MMDYTINNYKISQKSGSAEEQHKREDKSSGNEAFSPKGSPQYKDPPSKNNFKWTYEEHAKYIYFLELNKVRIKSKLIRKSNAFFKEMENFISTKTALQCRSHHQKFQERYKFPHRIITGEKKYIPIQTYNLVIQLSKVTDFLSDKQQGDNKIISGVMCKQEDVIKKQYVTISCQTEICNIAKNLYTEEQLKHATMRNYYVPPPQPYLYYHHYLNPY